MIPKLQLIGGQEFESSLHIFICLIFCDLKFVICQHLLLFVTPTMGIGHKGGEMVEHELHCGLNPTNLSV